MKRQVWITNNTSSSLRTKREMTENSQIQNWTGIIIISCYIFYADQLCNLLEISKIFCFVLLSLAYTAIIYRTVLSNYTFVYHLASRHNKSRGREFSAPAPTAFIKCTLLQFTLYSHSVFRVVSDCIVAVFNIVDSGDRQTPSVQATKRLPA